MSADNWTVCPRCLQKRAEDLRDMDARIAEAYGTEPMEVFEGMRTELATKQAEEMPRTFREDYEFWGASEGVVTASYRGHCSTCGLSHKFEHSEPIGGLS